MLLVKVAPAAATPSRSWSRWVEPFAVKHINRVLSLAVPVPAAMPSLALQPPNLYLTPYLVLMISSRLQLIPTMPPHACRCCARWRSMPCGSWRPPVLVWTRRRWRDRCSRGLLILSLHGARSCASFQISGLIEVSLSSCMCEFS